MKEKKRKYSLFIVHVLLQYYETSIVYFHKYLVRYYLVCIIGTIGLEF